MGNVVEELDQLFNGGRPNKVPHEDLDVVHPTAEADLGIPPTDVLLFDGAEPAPQLRDECAEGGAVLHRPLDQPLELGLVEGIDERGRPREEIGVEAVEGDSVSEEGEDLQEEDGGRVRGGRGRRRRLEGVCPELGVDLVHLLQVEAAQGVASDCHRLVPLAEGVLQLAVVVGEAEVVVVEIVRRQFQVSCCSPELRTGKPRTGFQGGEACFDLRRRQALDRVHFSQHRRP